MFKRIVEICDYFHQFSLALKPNLRFQASPLCTLSFISCCSIFKDHHASSLNFFQEARRRFTRDLDIIPYLGAFVKGFSKSFFNFFSNRSMFVEVRVDLTGSFEEVPFQGSSALIDLADLSFPSLYATFILYHIFWSLSRGFEKVFWVFSEPFRKQMLPFLTRLIYYIIS